MFFPLWFLADLAQWFGACLRLHLNLQEGRVEPLPERSPWVGKAWLVRVCARMCHSHVSGEHKEGALLDYRASLPPPGASIRETMAPLIEHLELACAHAPLEPTRGKEAQDQQIVHSINVVSMSFEAVTRQQAIIRNGGCSLCFSLQHKTKPGKQFFGQAYIDLTLSCIYFTHLALYSVCRAFGKGCGWWLEKEKEKGEGEEEITMMVTWNMVWCDLP